MTSGRQMVELMSSGGPGMGVVNSSQCRRGRGEAGRRLDVLSDDDLLECGDRSVRGEHGHALRLLDVMIEMECRSLHLQRGYSSLFDYCTRHWSFSPGKAGRDIAAARAMHRLPQVREALETRTLTVCAVARLATTLTDENCDELIRALAGKPYAAVEAVVMGQRDAPSIRDRVRPVGVQPRVCEGGKPGRAMVQPTVSSSDLPAGQPGSRCESALEYGADSQRESASEFPSDSQHESASASPSDSQHESLPAAPSDSQRESESKDPVFEIRFSARSRFVSKLRRLESILSSQRGLEAVLEKAIDDSLEQRDPARREARRAKRREARQTARRATRRATRASRPAPAAREDRPGQKGPPELVDLPDKQDPPSKSGPPNENSLPNKNGLPDRNNSADKSDLPDKKGSPGRTSLPDKQGLPDGMTSPNKRGVAERSRRIPVPVRDAVFSRDGHACTYVGPDGVLCGAQTYLQIDHVRPFARGGRHEPENLRVLCGRHNRFEAEREGLLREAVPG